MVERRNDALEARVKAVEIRQDLCDSDRMRYNAFMEEVRKNTAATADSTAKLKQMMTMFDDAMAALKGIATLGKAVKWIAGIIAAIGGAYFAFKGIHT